MDSQRLQVREQGLLRSLVGISEKPAAKPAQIDSMRTLKDCVLIDKTLPDADYRIHAIADEIFWAHERARWPEPSRGNVSPSAKVDVIHELAEIPAGRLSEIVAANLLRDPESQKRLSALLGMDVTEVRVSSAHDDHHNHFDLSLTLQDKKQTHHVAIDVTQDTTLGYKDGETLVYNIRNGVRSASVPGLHENMPLALLPIDTALTNTYLQQWMSAIMEEIPASPVELYRSAAMLTGKRPGRFHVEMDILLKNLASAILDGLENKPIRTLAMVRALQSKHG